MVLLKRGQNTLIGGAIIFAIGLTIGVTGWLDYLNFFSLVTDRGYDSVDEIINSTTTKIFIGILLAIPGIIGMIVGAVLIVLDRKRKKATAKEF